MTWTPAHKVGCPALAMPFAPADACTCFEPDTPAPPAEEGETLEAAICRELGIEKEYIGELRYWAPAEPGPCDFPTLVEALRFLVDLPDERPSALSQRVRDLEEENATLKAQIAQSRPRRIELPVDTPEY